jgi:hypothetical protein
MYKHFYTIATYQCHKLQSKPLQPHTHLGFSRLSRPDVFPLQKTLHTWTREQSPPGSRDGTAARHYQSKAASKSTVWPAARECARSTHPHPHGQTVMEKKKKPEMRCDATWADPAALAKQATRANCESVPPTRASPKPLHTHHLSILLLQGYAVTGRRPVVCEISR